MALRREDELSCNIWLAEPRAISNEYHNYNSVMNMLFDKKLCISLFTTSYSSLGPKIMHSSTESLLLNSIPVHTIILLRNSRKDGSFIIFLAMSCTPSISWWKSAFWRSIIFFRSTDYSCPLALLCVRPFWSYAWQHLATVSSVMCTLSAIRRKESSVLSGYKFYFKRCKSW